VERKNAKTACTRVKRHADGPSKGKKRVRERRGQGDDDGAGRRRGKKQKGGGENRKGASEKEGMSKTKAKEGQTVMGETQSGTLM